ncbi:CoA transferase [Streptomyces sp. SID8352]|nr:CoA transferase [Streptomyces sp. SID8352]
MEAEERAQADKPLAGLVVADFTQFLSGPFATMLLADLGADVIKIESPKGDITRGEGPWVPGDAERVFGGYFQSVNRNKRSLVLNLKAPGAADAVQRIVRRCDIVVENYRSGVMERAGCGYETLAQANPRLIYAALRGFGDDRTGRSPYGDWPAYDVVAQAMGGLMEVNGQPGGPPTKVGPGIGDIFPATLLAVGILSAVHRRERTGRGGFVDVAMLDAILSLCERLVYQHSYTGAVPTRIGNEHPILCPFGVYPTSDGWVALAAPGNHHWAELARLMGRPELVDDPAFATNEERTAHSAEVRRVVEDWSRHLTTGEVLRTLGGVIPVGPVNSISDIYADAHAQIRGMLPHVEDPSGRAVQIAGNPIKMTDSRLDYHRAPYLGEHNSVVLSELGFSEAAVQELVDRGVVVSDTRREARLTSGGQSPTPLHRADPMKESSR